MLLAISINSIESVQSFIFYLIQYSISNLNAFILLIAIGYSLYFYNDKNINHNKLIDKNNSPIQFISQLKGYFHINSMLALSLTITLFSFAGIPPLIGFFAKQMIFSSALQEGFIFQKNKVIEKIYYSKFVLSNSLTITISILTLIILLFIFMPNELLYISNILTIIFFVPLF